MEEKNLLKYGFLNSVRNFPNHPALVVEGDILSYSELFNKAASLAVTIAMHEINEPLLTAVFASRSVTAYAGVLGSLMMGHGYVPLNNKFPPDRNKKILQSAGCKSMIVDRQSESELDQLLRDMKQKMLIILPENTNTRELNKKWEKHVFIGKNEIESFKTWQEPNVISRSPAYIMFTSGSTGVPKGVVVTHENVIKYVEFITERFSITEKDRFSQMFDLTFDLSVADMFVAWSRGACLYCPSEKILINPGQYINESQLTVWFSVPSTAIFMKRLGGLKPNSYPKLRISMFCGEALPIEVVKSWADACPNSIIENLYGPTELTIACTYYRWDPFSSKNQYELGIVPIGYPFPGMSIMIVDELLQEVAPGETGELLMTGPQVSAGYWKDSERTSKAFIVPMNKQEVYYRTGDRVRKPVGDLPLTYLGRIDNQIKILGHRVELSEIESVIRDESGIDAVVAVGWPLNTSGANGIEVFVQGSGIKIDELKDRVSNQLPNYMLPKHYHFLDQLPVNANGKFDRKALIKYLEDN
jgi:amino acid adenylation domain-containing protein